MNNKLFISRVKPEPRREIRLLRTRRGIGTFHGCRVSLFSSLRIFSMVMATVFFREKEQEHVIVIVTNENRFVVLVTPQRVNLVLYWYGKGVARITYVKVHGKVQ